MRRLDFAVIGSALVGVALLGAACGGDDDDGTTVDANTATNVDGATSPDAMPEPEADADPNAIPRVEAAPCRFSTPVIDMLPLEEGVDFVCGDLIVYENRETPADGGTLRLHFFQMFSDVDTGNATIYLDGGPGGNGDGIIAYMSFLGAGFVDGLLAQGDFLVIAQRGTSLSEPDLSCTSEDMTLADCADRLSQDATLANFTTASNADDIDELREVLGYDKLNVYGISYGSRLTLEVLRRHGDNVRAAIAGGTVPAHIIWPAEIPASFFGALSGMAAECNADAACQAEFGDLVDDVLTAIPDLNADPVVYSNGTDVDVAINGTTYAYTLFSLFYSRGYYQFMPILISDLAERRTDRVAPLLDSIFADSGEGGGGTATGMYYSIVCGELFNPPVETAFEDANGTTPQQLKDVFFQFSWNGLLTVCETWPVGPPTPVLTEAVVSDVPTLIPNGALDPITPPRFGDAAAEYLTAEHTVVFPRSGHGSTLQTDCGQQVLFDFLANPTEAPDTTCTASIPINFFVPGTSLAPPQIDRKRLELERRMAPIPPHIRDYLHSLRIRRGENPTAPR